MTLLRRLRYLLRQRRIDAEIAAEIETHRLMIEERLRREGRAPAEAAATSRRLMGNLTLAREDARAAWLAPWIQSVWQDLRYAVRHLRAHPASTVTAAVTLVLATGLNTSFFSVFNAVMLRPWPVGEPERVVLLHALVPADRGQSGFLQTDFTYLAGHARSFAGLTAMRGGGARVSAAADVPFHHVQAGFVSASFFDVMRIPMAAGRGFLPLDDVAGASAVVVIGNGLWERAFGSEPSVIGRTILVNDIPATVVGVTASGRVGGDAILRRELWMTLATATAQRSFSPCCVSVAGRLAPDTTRETARAELVVLMAGLDAAAHRQPRAISVTGTRPIEQPGYARRTASFALMLGALVIVLLLACANVGNLQLARAIARRRELAIRLSLGAARGRVIRQLLTETLVLAAVSGGLALAIGAVAPTAILNAMGEAPPMPLQPDWSVVLFAIALCSVSTAAIGLAPALRGTRDAADFIAVQRGTIGIRRPALRAVLLSAQIALSGTLLFGATLLTRGLIHASTIDPGYDLDGVAIARVTLPADAYDWARAENFVTELKQALPSSVAAPVGFVDYAPLQPSSLGASVRRPQDPRDDERRVHLRSVSAGAFDALGIPLVTGRIYTDQAVSEIVVNETLARMFWSGSPALGEQLIDRSTTYTVVGVAKDVRFSGLGAIEPMIYMPRLLSKMPQLLFKNQDRETAERLRATVLGLEPRASVTIAPLAETVRESLRFSYTGVVVGWLLGGLALLLAIVGVFGVFSYIVEERTREIGIRLALGAGRSEVLALVFRATRSSVLIGLGCAGVLAIVTGFVLRSYLFGLSPFDPLAYAGAATLIALAALIATAIPVRRATRVDPVLVLRLE